MSKALKGRRKAEHYLEDSGGGGSITLKSLRKAEHYLEKSLRKAEHYLEEPEEGRALP